jgi:hypothetical protein
MIHIYAASRPFNRGETIVAVGKAPKGRAGRYVSIASKPLKRLRKGYEMSKPTLHPALELVAADDWNIAGTLLDLDGSPFDLTGASLEWRLISPDGLVAASFPGTASLTVLDAPGAITIGVHDGR